MQQVILLELLIPLEIWFFSFFFFFSYFSFFSFFIKLQSMINKISNETIESTKTSYTFTNLNSNTLYRMRLFTQVSSSSSSYFRDVISATYPSRIFFSLFFFFHFDSLNCNLKIKILKLKKNEINSCFRNCNRTIEL